MQKSPLGSPLQTTTLFLIGALLGFFLSTYSPILDAFFRNYPSAPTMLYKIIDSITLVLIITTWRSWRSFALGILVSFTVFTILGWYVLRLLALWFATP